MNTISVIQARDLSLDVASALLEIRTVAPTLGEVVEQAIVHDRVDFAALHFLRPEDSVVVARTSAGNIAGFLVSKIRLANLNGRPCTVNYLSGARVHPDHRLQGIGTSLVQACLSLGEESGAAAHWAGVEPHNVPSLRTLQKVGFVQARPIRVAGFPLAGLAGGDALPGLECRPGETSDLADAVNLLDSTYLGHNFWSPVTGYHLWRETQATASSHFRHDLGDFFVVRDSLGEMRATGLVYDQAAIESRVVKEILSPAGRIFDRLGPLVALSPAHEAIPRTGRAFAKLFVHYFAATDRDAALSLLRGIAREWADRGSGWPTERRPVMIVCQQLTGVLEVRIGLIGDARFVLGLGGYATSVNVLVRSGEPVDSNRPWWLNFWT
jgi:ribosomal protein S18 acetylase RimI-like enzyme